MKELINEIDPHAFITVYDVAEVKAVISRNVIFINRYIKRVCQNFGTPSFIIKLLSLSVFVGKSIYSNNR